MLCLEIPFYLPVISSTIQIFHITQQQASLLPETYCKLVTPTLAIAAEVTFSPRHFKEQIKYRRCGYTSAQPHLHGCPDGHYVYSALWADSLPDRTLKMKGLQFASINHAIKCYSPSNQSSNMPAPVPVHACVHVCICKSGTNYFSNYVPVITKYWLHWEVWTFHCYSEFVTHPHQKCSHCKRKRK